MKNYLEQNELLFFFYPVENIYQRQINKNYLNKQKSHFTGFT